MKKYIVCCLLALAISLGNSLQAETKPAPKQESSKTSDKTKTSQFSGTITAVDVNAATVTVKHSSRDDSKNFKCHADCKFATLEKKEAGLADLKQGDKVLVHYTEDNGAATAKKIAPTKSARNQAKKAAQ